MTTYAGLYGPEALIDGTGHPITSATIDVFTHGTTTHVSLFKDNARVTPLSNPVPNGVDGSTAGGGLDTYGNLSFYVDPGRYDLRIATGAGTRTVEIEIETDPAENAASGAPADALNTVASSGSAVTLPDVTTATVNDVTLTAATVALTFPAVPVAAATKSFTLILRQDTTGSRLVTWPSNIKWTANSAPVLTTGAAKFDVITFLSVDATNWIGMVVGQNFGVTPTLVTDTFNRADAATLGTADTGQTWNGTAVGIVSNQAAVKGSGVSWVESGNADVTYTTTWMVISGQVRQVIRYTDANNYWFAGAVSGLSLYKKVAGVFTQVANYPGSPVNGDIVTITTNGSSIIVKLNGSVVCSSLGDTFNQTATKCGLESSTGDTTVRWDNLSITAP